MLPRSRVRYAVTARPVTRTTRSLIVWLIACYAFLYAPIAFLVALSFNASRLVTAWDGFSLRWYAALWHDKALIAAALLSLRIAAASATLALIVGTLAGYALARFGCFRDARRVRPRHWRRRWCCPRSSPASRCCCCSWRCSRRSAGRPGAAPAP